jgi:hypothetical protein
MGIYDRDYYKDHARQRDRDPRSPPPDRSDWWAGFWWGVGAGAVLMGLLAKSGVWRL